MLEEASRKTMADEKQGGGMQNAFYPKSSISGGGQREQHKTIQDMKNAYRNQYLDK